MSNDDVLQAHMRATNVQNNGAAERITFSAVSTDGGPGQNEGWSSRTPQGNASFNITNRDAFGSVLEGEEVLITIRKVQNPNPAGPANPAAIAGAPDPRTQMTTTSIADQQAIADAEANNQALLAQPAPAPGVAATEAPAPANVPAAPANANVGRGGRNQ